MVKILTMDEVRKQAKDGVIEVEKGTKFTPMAQDYISENQLEVREVPKKTTVAPTRSAPSYPNSPPKAQVDNSPLDEARLGEVVQEGIRRLKERGLV